MTLQQRLLLLLTAFSGFSLLASFGTIIALHAHTVSASARFEESLHETLRIDAILGATSEQYIALAEIVAGHAEADDLYLAQRDEFFIGLRHLADYGAASISDDARQQLVRIHDQLQHDFEACLRYLEAGNQLAALQVLETHISQKEIPALRVRLGQIMQTLEERRNRALDSLAAQNTTILILAVVIGTLGFGLVAIGIVLIRRWIIQPIHELSTAARAFGSHQLSHRVTYTRSDELGELASAMNQMAGSLAQSEAELRQSESKYRALFENQRDAVIICSADGVVRECCDGETGVLGSASSACSGHDFPAALPRLVGLGIDWRSLLDAAIKEDQRSQLYDLRLPGPDANTEETIIDVIVYPVQLESERLAAIVLRDVTTRRIVELQARQTQTMQATISLSRGIAHDFNNLLNSASNSLRSLEQKLPGDALSTYVKRAASACRHASGLAKKLLQFASGSRGTPEIVSLSATARNIIDALDDSLDQQIRVTMRWDERAWIEIDPDHLTQIILNLVHNSREAMPGGGELALVTEVIQDAKSRPHALLTVTDTGCGISDKVRRRMFEPFFSTKKSATERSRGLGLAVVYTLASDVGGEISVRSELGQGTSITIQFPLVQPPADEAQRLITQTFYRN